MFLFCWKIIHLIIHNIRNKMHRIFFLNVELSMDTYSKCCRGLFQNPQYDIKDSTGTLHTGISQTATYYPYDHSLGQYQYDRYVLSFFCRNKHFTRMLKLCKTLISQSKYPQGRCDDFGSQWISVLKLSDVASSKEEMVCTHHAVFGNADPSSPPPQIWDSRF